jgi:hypothetical protein
MPSALLGHDGFSKMPVPKSCHPERSVKFGCVLISSQIGLEGSAALQSHGSLKPHLHCNARLIAKCFRIHGSAPLLLRGSRALVPTKIPTSQTPLTPCHPDRARARNEQGRVEGSRGCTLQHAASGSSLGNIFGSRLGVELASKGFAPQHICGVDTVLMY